MGGSTVFRSRVDLANEEKAAVSCALQGRRIFAKTTKIQSLPPAKEKPPPKWKAGKCRSKALMHICPGREIWCGLDTL